jgi:non-specific serine/threonine protein kinase
MHNNAWGVISTLSGQAHLALALGNIEGAAGLLQQGESLARAKGDPFSLAANLNLQAALAYMQGDDSRAVTLAQKSVQLSATLRDAWAIVYGFLVLAGVAARRGQAARAVRLYGATKTVRDATATDLVFTVLTYQYEPGIYLYEPGIATARAQLDADAFASAWEQGQAMPLQEAIAFALSDTPGPAALHG